MRLACLARHFFCKMYFLWAVTLLARILYLKCSSCLDLGVVLLESEITCADMLDKAYAKAMKDVYLDLPCLD